MAKKRVLPPGYERPVSEKREAKMKGVIARRQPTLTIVMENIMDPHNISAILRSCDAVGIPEIYVLNSDIPLSKKLGRRSSASARKWVKVNYYTDTLACVQELKSKGFSIWGTHLSADAKGLYEMQLSEPVALVFGNEHKGVSNEILEHCDGNFIIPMMGMIPSLNVSVACAVTLYEAYRQRAASGMYEAQQFTEAESADMYKEWSKK